MPRGRSKYKHKHKYPKGENNTGGSHKRDGIEQATRYIPFVLCWVLFVLAIGISLS
ncbi:hypothetical protein RN616_12635 [Morganella morganii]|uniref:hypothetical protein n=1 Tax=Morganella morganii TaxID=582 RepID=UPI0022A2736D|nr:hypothetical protein [Morganella morganii]WNP29376.1 hypothetical protein RN616_12635 [Morganella morganii]HCT4330323.1 hypothetical protein [Morganella morganii]HEI8419539.1 hypothetical protein [Morganella morganii]